MNLDEIDWRSSSTQHIFHVISDALKEMKKTILGVQPEAFELDDALEYSENLLGIAFVVAQTYIAGTVSDFNKLTGDGHKQTKDQLLKNYGEKLAESTVTKLELCDAIANYFKHHDEWGSWTIIGRPQKTIATLQSAGITKKDEFPCMQAAKILFGNESLDSESLLASLANWRKAALATVRIDTA